MPKSSSKRKSSGKSARKTAKAPTTSTAPTASTAPTTSKAPTTSSASSAWEDIYASHSSAPSVSPLYSDRVKSPLAWGQTGLDIDPDSPASSSQPAQLIVICERLAQGEVDEETRATNWEELTQAFLESASERVNRETCYQALAWAHAAQSLSTLLDSSAWAAIMRGLEAMVVDLIDQGTADDGVVEQLLVELGITLQMLFPHVAELPTYVDDLRKRASFAITDLTDGQGIPRSGIVRDLRPLVASWVRLGLLAHQTNNRVFEDDAQMQLEWLIRQSIVLSRRGGAPLFTSQPRDGSSDDAPYAATGQVVSKASADFFEVALAWECDDDDARYAGSLINVGPLKPKGKKNKRALANDLELEFECPTLYSEWASLAVMRSSWESRGPIVGVAFDDRKILTDISSKPGPIVCGDVTPFIKINGQLAEFSSDISEVCWHSDDECDYMELEVKLGAGWRLQRQYLFGREDEFLWVADVLLGNESAQIEYSCPWPISSACEVVPEKETRDMTLSINDRIQSCVMPAAAPEWRVTRSQCELEMSDVGLHHRFTAETRAAYIPLFFDLDKKRARTERTWRRLTVAEQLEITPPDVAAGFRVQSGDDQWMFYRSLGARGNRSLLGQNTVAEFLAGRFLRDGLLDELVEVE